jgi:hypothetical protein
MNGMKMFISFVKQEVEINVTMVACVWKDVDSILHANVQRDGRDDFVVLKLMNAKVRHVKMVPFVLIKWQHMRASVL